MISKPFDEVEWKGLKQMILNKENMVPKERYGEATQHGADSETQCESSEF